MDEHEEGNIAQTLEIQHARTLTWLTCLDVLLRASVTHKGLGSVLQIASAKEGVGSSNAKCRGWGRKTYLEFDIVGKA